jgi:hypothetical protein
MTKADNDPTTTTTPPCPSRRIMLTGASAALLAGAAAPAVARGAPAVPDGADGADAELIAACAAFDALEMRVRGLFSGPDDIASEDARDAAMTAIAAEQEPFLERICALFGDYSGRSPRPGALTGAMGAGPWGWRLGGGSPTCRDRPR